MGLGVAPADSLCGRVAAVVVALVVAVAFVMETVLEMGKAGLVGLPYRSQIAL